MRGRRILINILTSVLIVATICFGIFSLVCIVFNFTHIKSDVNQFSMYPTLNGSAVKENDAGDVVYINRFANIARGDIVVASVSWNDDPIIKRAVALPGDTLYISEEGNFFNLYVNDVVFYSVPLYVTCPLNGVLQRVSTRGHDDLFYIYLNEHKQNTIVENGITKLLMGEDEYFLVGDNWALSEDSTKYGPVQKCDIIGNVDVIIHSNQNKLNMLIYSLLKMLFSQS